MKQLIKKRENGTVRIQTVNEKPSRTKKSMREMVNVNAIMKKYRQTGMITHMNGKTGTYGDFSAIKDFAGALNTVIQARQAFDVLPAEIRSRFGNNPEELIKFLKDPKNVDESIKLGLRVKPEEPKIPKVEIVNPQNVNTQSASQNDDQTISQQNKGNGDSK